MLDIESSFNWDYGHVPVIVGKEIISVIANITSRNLLIYIASDFHQEKHKAPLR
jgi:hypothetical protein